MFAGYVVNTLKSLVKDFSNIYVQCREYLAIEKYQSYFNSCQEWSLSASMQALPIKQFRVALYILYLIQQDFLFPVIESYFYAINFNHL